MRENSHIQLTIRSLFRNAEQAKIREYRDRIRDVEHADFNPLVFTCACGITPQCHLVLKRLAEQLSKKQNIPLSVVSGWLRCRLSFALLRTTLLCVRATRRKRFVVDNNIELARAWSTERTVTPFHLTLPPIPPSLHRHMLSSPK